ncbi:MAG: DUF4232 domain-containing protein [Actinomycetota bacterium]
MMAYARALPAVALVALLAGCALPHPAGPVHVPAAGSTATTDPREGPVHVDPVVTCQAADLGISLGTPDHEASTEHLPIVFTNRGGGTCTLTGWPRVSVITVFNQTLVGPEARPLGTASPAVVLGVNGTAIADLQSVILDSGGGPLGSRCLVATGNGYLVNPPGSSVSVVVPAAGTVYGCLDYTWMNITVVH